MFLAQEEINIKAFPDCIPKPIATEDLIFLYPNDFISKPDETMKLLQKTFDLLRQLTDLNPTGKLPSETNSARITIGFHKKYTNTMVWTGSGGNLIFMPWKRRLWKDEPQAGCTHELVHPFYRISELFEGENEVWGDSFCEFMRGPLKNNIGQDGISWWKEKVKNAEEKKDSEGGTGAGLLILEAKEIYRGNDYDSYKFVEEFINDISSLNDYIQRLRKEYSLTPLHSRERFFLTEKMKIKLDKIKRKMSH